MSVKIMSMVFDRYPNGGGEMVLALAIADHAHDDGTSIYPSIKQLAVKTRQSERTVQYQLRRLEECGWLVLDNSGNGGRNQRREYHIAIEWLKGADFALLPKGAIHSTKGANGDIKGADSGTKGCSQLHPHITVNNHQEPSKNHQQQAAPVPDAAEDSPDPVLFEFLLNDATTYGLRQSQVSQFAALYPAVDLPAQLRACMGWNFANPTRRKTRTGILKHINSWLAEKQNAPAQARASPTPYQQKQDQRQSLLDRIQGKKHAEPTIIDLN